MSLCTILINIGFMGALKNDDLIKIFEDIGFVIYL